MNMTLQGLVLQQPNPKASILVGDSIRTETQLQHLRDGWEALFRRLGNSDASKTQRLIARIEQLFEAADKMYAPVDHEAIVVLACIPFLSRNKTRFFLPEVKRWREYSDIVDGVQRISSDLKSALNNRSEANLGSTSVGDKVIQHMALHNCSEHLSAHDLGAIGLEIKRITEDDSLEDGLIPAVPKYATLTYLAAQGKLNSEGNHFLIYNFEEASGGKLKSPV